MKETSRDSISFANEVTSYRRLSRKPIFGSSSKKVPGKEVDRDGRNSKRVNNWRDPNPFLARYYECTPSEDHSLTPNGKGFGFPVTVYDTFVPAGEKEPITELRRHGLWYTYPNAVTNFQHASNHRESKEMESIVIAQSYNALKDSPVHLGMFLAELGPTLSHLALTYRTITMALRYLRKGRVADCARTLINANAIFRPHELNAMRKKAARLKDTSKTDVDLLDVVSSKWLELQFAWKPLLADVKGLIDLAPHVSDAAQMPRVTGRRVLLREFNDLEDVKNYNTRTFGPCLTSITRATSETAVICRTDWSVGDPTLYMLSMLGLINPLEVAWDKVPFSFVIDWFIPVGTWISAMTADTGLNYLGGSLTTSSKSTVTVNTVPMNNGGYVGSLRTEGGGSFSITEKDTVRGVFTAEPSLRLPPLRYPSTLWHAITGGALLFQTKDLITSNLKVR